MKVNWKFKARMGRSERDRQWWWGVRNGLIADYLIYYGLEDDLTDLHVHGWVEVGPFETKRSA
jgi:hypothetical protein